MPHLVTSRIGCIDLIHDLFRHYQKGLRLDPEHSELKKAYFGLKNLLKKTKSVGPLNIFLNSPSPFCLYLFEISVGAKLHGSLAVAYFLKQPSIFLYFLT